MLNIFKLGYVDFFVRDMESMTRYYSDVIGLTVTEQDGEGRVYLSTALDHHNIVLTPSDKTGINRFGFQFEDTITIKEAQDHLKELGIQSEIKTDASPGVPELLEFTDPEGYIVELYPKMTLATPGFKNSGIVPNKVGHLSLRVKDAKKQVEFYEQLGFINTDWIESYFGFMTCNQDHHVLNFFTSEKEGMHHLAFETRNYQHLVQSLDILRHNNIKIEWGPSRHGAGHNVATYHYDPENNLIELFTDVDIYIKELNCFEPRPWHRDCPQRPKVWSTDECLSVWGVDFEKALV